MAIVAADKIFVDVNDEINFVVEKFLQSSSDQVILVCPQNALIVSSQVSIKILVKQMLKAKKLLIIVTEDDFGARIAQSAGLVVTSKVSQVSTNMWAQAARMKELLQNELEERKKTLLQERGIIESEHSMADDEVDFVIDMTEVHEHEEEQAAEVDLTETVEQEIEPKMEVESEELEEPVAAAPLEIETKQGTEAEIDSANPLSLPAETDMDAHEPETVVESETETEMPVVDEPEPEPIIGAIQRKRPQPKVVNVGNLTIMAGGDISKQ